ncbi:MAG: hypothetical protein WC852_07690 [Candidatus Nanoarchaeia archaeon]|jgi:hypothetical protein
MDKRALFIFSVVLLAGMFLFGEGITGLYVMEFTQQPCGSNAGCSEAGQACCKFYNENFGVCDRQANCDAIGRVTFDARRKVSTYELMSKDEKYKLFNTMSVHVEAPKKPSNLYSLIAGMILVLIALIGIFIGKVRDIHAGRSHSLYRTKDIDEMPVLRKKKAVRKKKK